MAINFALIFTTLGLSFVVGILIFFVVMVVSNIKEKILLRKISKQIKGFETDDIGHADAVNNYIKSLTGGNINDSKERRSEVPRELTAESFIIDSGSDRPVDRLQPSNEADVGSPERDSIPTKTIVEPRSPEPKPTSAKPSPKRGFQPTKPTAI